MNSIMFTERDLLIWVNQNGKEDKFSRRLIASNRIKNAFINEMDELDISNTLTPPPNFIGSFIKLKKLNLTNNHLNQFPLSVGNLLNLNTLNLTKKFIKFYSNNDWPFKASYNTLPYRQ